MSPFRSSAGPRPCGARRRARGGRSARGSSCRARAARRAGRGRGPRLARWRRRARCELLLDPLLTDELRQATAAAASPRVPPAPQRRRHEPVARRASWCRRRGELPPPGGLRFVKVRARALSAHAASSARRTTAPRPAARDQSRRALLSFEERPSELDQRLAREHALSPTPRRWPHGSQRGKLLLQLEHDVLGRLAADARNGLEPCGVLEHDRAPEFPRASTPTRSRAPPSAPRPRRRAAARRSPARPRQRTRTAAARPPARAGRSRSRPRPCHALRPHARRGGRRDIRPRSPRARARHAVREATFPRRRAIRGGGEKEGERSGGGGWGDGRGVWGGRGGGGVEGRGGGGVARRVAAQPKGGGGREGQGESGIRFWGCRDVQERRRERMANRDRERVRGVVRLRHLRQAEDRLDHPLHLLLLGMTVAGHGALHPRRRIFGALDIGARARDEHGPPRLSDGERDAGIDADERLLQGDGIWPVPSRSAPPPRRRSLMSRAPGAPAAGVRPPSRARSALRRPSLSWTIPYPQAAVPGSTPRTFTARGWVPFRTSFLRRGATWLMAKPAFSRRDARPPGSADRGGRRAPARCGAGVSARAVQASPAGLRAQVDGTWLGAPAVEPERAWGRSPSSLEAVQAPPAKPPASRSQYGWPVGDEFRAGRPDYASSWGRIASMRSPPSGYGGALVADARVVRFPTCPYPAIEPDCPLDRGQGFAMSGARVGELSARGRPGRFRFSNASFCSV